MLFLVQLNSVVTSFRPQDSPNDRKKMWSLPKLGPEICNKNNSGKNNRKCLGHDTAALSYFC